MSETTSKNGEAAFIVFCDDCDLNTGHVERKEAKRVRTMHRDVEPDHDCHLMERLA